MSNNGSQDKISELVDSDVDIVQMEIPDVNGALRGKFCTIEKIKPSSKSAVCTVLYQMTPVDDVWTSIHSSYDNGFPDVLGLPDIETAIALPWRRGQGAVIYDVHHLDHSPYPLASRNVLKSVAQRFEQTGYEPKFGVEFECFVMHEDNDLMAKGEHAKLTGLGRLSNAYRLNQADEARELGAEFIRRMRSIGITVEVFHTELGDGAVEFALSPEGAVRAADNAARAKTYFKELCAERGLVATFMAKWNANQAGCGGHIHQSLWRDGKNVFKDEKSSDLSKVARSYIAGMLATMVDTGVIFRPFPNSYRRFDHEAWSPENASWGYDNRSAALRAITYPSDAAFRVEHRVPGADVNLYLSIAAMLAGGLYGIQNNLELSAAAEGNATKEDRFDRLPDTLPASTDAFRKSKFCREFFGDTFVEHFAASRDVEWEYWCDWQRKNVSAFELERYFETV